VAHPPLDQAQQVGIVTGVYTPAKMAPRTERLFEDPAEPFTRARSVVAFEASSARSVLVCAPSAPLTDHVRKLQRYAAAAQP